MSRLAGRTVALDAVSLNAPLTGIGRYTWHLAQALVAELAVAPRFFYGYEWSDAVRPPPKPGLAAKSRSLVARFVPRPDLISRFLMQRHFDRGAKGIDLYHEPHLPFRFRGRMVMTVHDISWVRHPGTHPADRVRLMDALMPRGMREAAHLITDSEFVRGELIDYYGIAPEKVTTVHLGVDETFAPLGEAATRDALSRHGLRHGEYLLAVGTLEPRKNLATLIEAHRQLPEALRARLPLAVVGMQGWGMEQLPQRIRGLVESGEVRMLGFVAQEDLPAVYSGARLFAYPSIYEGFGLPPLEAMACGVPTIVSRRASLPEVVGDAAVLVEPDDAGRLAQVIGDLAEDGARRAALSAAGIARARGFTWGRCAQETIGIYERVLL